MLGTFGGRSGPEMFSSLEEKINDFLSTSKEAKVSYQTCNKDAESAFILVIMTTDDQSVSEGIFCLQYLYIGCYILSANS